MTDFKKIENNLKYHKKLTPKELAISYHIRFKKDNTLERELKKLLSKLNWTFIKHKIDSDTKIKTLLFKPSNEVEKEPLVINNNNNRK